MKKDSSENPTDATIKKPLLFRMIKGSVAFFYKKITFSGTENLPDEPSLIIGNHTQLHGPLISEIYFPTKKYTWCIGEMMTTKEVPSYAYNDFWSNKPKAIRPFFKVVSYLMAPLAAYIFTHADTIGVYKDQRIISTFKKTVEALHKGANIVIFPEDSEPFNEIVNDFQDKFVDVARLYYKMYGKEVYFVPLYNAPNLKKAVLGKPIKFDASKPVNEQRKIICDYLKSEITALAKDLPPHTVVPYNNVKKKLFPKSK